jgi:TRAP-type C4-dicarboxylate transport system permease small subunit
VSASSPSNLKKIGHFLGNLEQWVLVLLLGFLAAFAVTQIILRNFLSVGLVWGDDLLRHGVLWISLLGATRATLERKHIRIDLLPRILPARLGLIADSPGTLSRVNDWPEILPLPPFPIGGWRLSFRSVSG